MPLTQDMTNSSFDREKCVEQSSFGYNSLLKTFWTDIKENLSKLVDLTLVIDQKWRCVRGKNLNPHKK